MGKHLFHPTSRLTKVWVGVLIFLSILVVGGLAIFAATNLNDLKAGANKQRLTSKSWDTLIDSVNAQNTALGEKIKQLETGQDQVNQTINNLLGSRNEKIKIGTVNEVCNAKTAGMLRDNRRCLEYCNGSTWKSISCATFDEVPLRTIIATYGADRAIMNRDGRALCNGTSIASQVGGAAVSGNTPNLAGKMLVGAGTFNAATFTDGKEYYTYRGQNYYGAVRHTLTANEMPSHRHTISDPGHFHTAVYGRGVRHRSSGDRYNPIS
jgi:hypothetical protein